MNIKFAILMSFPLTTNQQTQNWAAVHTEGKTVKGKAIPLHAWTDPEGSRRLRLPDFKTIGT